MANCAANSARVSCILAKRIQEPERYHAPASPSAAYMWFKCADSINAPDKGSNDYAEEGTAAHELLGLCFVCDCGPHDFIGTMIYKHWVVTEEMADAVAQCLDYVKSYMTRYPKAKLLFDLKVDAHALVGCPPDFISGTLDVCIDNFPLELVNIDYKHGRMTVYAKNNLQTLQYLLNYYGQFGTAPYEKYTNVIAQPRDRNRSEDGPIKEDTITHADLMVYRTKLKKRLAYMKKHPHERVAGDHCYYCGFAGACKELAKEKLRIARQEFSIVEEHTDAKLPNPRNMKPEDVCYIVTQAVGIEKWLKDVYAEALASMLRGHKSKFLKFVHGKTNRFITNDRRMVKALLAENFTQRDIMIRKLIGIPAIEKLFRERMAGKRLRKGDELLPESIAKLIKRPAQPPLHVALITDKRPAVVRGSEFSEIDEPDF